MLIDQRGIYKSNDFADIVDALIQAGVTANIDTVVKIEYYPFSKQSINQKINNLSSVPDGEKMLLKLSIPYDVSDKLDTVALDATYRTHSILSARIAELNQVFSSCLKEALALREAFISLVNNYSAWDSFITSEKNLVYKNLGEINSLIHGFNNLAWKSTKLPDTSEIFLYSTVKESIEKTTARRLDGVNLQVMLDNIVWLADKISNLTTVNILGEEYTVILLSVINDRITEINSKLTQTLTTFQIQALQSERLKLRLAQRDLVNARITITVQNAIDAAYTAGTKGFINQQLTELGLDSVVTATTRNYFRYDVSNYVSSETANIVTASPISTAWQVTIDLLESQIQGLQRDIDFLSNTNLGSINTTKIATLNTKKTTINQVITNIKNVLDNYHVGRVLSLTVTLVDESTITFLEPAAYEAWTKDPACVCIITGPGAASLAIKIIDPITAPYAYRVDIAGVPYIFVSMSEYEAYQVNPALFTTTPGFGNAVYVNRITG